MCERCQKSIQHKLKEVVDAILAKPIISIGQLRDEIAIAVLEVYGIDELNHIMKNIRKEKDDV